MATVRGRGWDVATSGTARCLLTGGGALVLAAGVLLAMPVPAHAQQPPAPSPICVIAADLLAEKMPVRAVALIEAHRRVSPNATNCAATYEQAVAAVTRSATRAAEARQALAAEQWDEAARLADAALAVDRENASAARVKSLATESRRSRRGRSKRSAGGRRSARATSVPLAR